MLVMLVCWCVIRVSYIMLVARASGDIQMVFWAYPLTWALSLRGLPHLLRARRLAALPGTQGERGLTRPSLLLTCPAA